MSEPTIAETDPVNRLPGVGAERSRQLERLKIQSVGDLLLHAPKRYEDRRQFLSIGQIQEKGIVTTAGTVVECGTKRFARGRKSLLTVVIDDGTGRLHLRWWNMPFMEKNFRNGMTLVASGRIKDLKPRIIDHPDVEEQEEGDADPLFAKRIVPLYPLTEGLTQRSLRALIWRALFECGLQVEERYPEDLLWGRPGHRQALEWLHFPAELHQTRGARERLAMEEFLDMQLAIQGRRRNFELKAPRLECAGDNRMIKRFLPSLGYSLTHAQTAVLREVRQDFANGTPMRRLLQGDVGSGKTVVAACSALMAIESGFSAALMAPTEILAEQHYRTFRRWFNPLGVPVKIWTGNTKSELSTSAELPLEDQSNGPVLVVGTHALITRSFELPDPGLVIIDEQHRFGVAQREALVRKGRYPHLLVMTATPIPRTLGLTLYGDLDISVIDELPPGRKPIHTFVRPGDKLPKVWDFVREHLQKGEQAYVVYARVESDTTGKAVLKELEMLQAALLPFKVEAMHGKLSAEEKEAVMARFRANKTQVLAASSLIEVGVDVPNATIMVIEDAEKFGLAQLHQLRGRIGRGARESYCILISSAKDDESKERLKVLEESSDGFKIAEADMKFRGPGDLLGHDQSGIPDLRFGDLLNDFDLVREARRIALTILKEKAEAVAH